MSVQAVRSIDPSATVRHLAQFAEEPLATPGVSEVCVNRPGEIWVEAGGQWVRHEAPSLDLEHLLALATAVARYCEDDVSDLRPILSAVLPSGERIQIVMPPACEPGTVSVSIRRPAEERFTIPELENKGLFEHVQECGQQVEPPQLPHIECELLSYLWSGDYAEFLQLAVRRSKTIVVAGRTSSGKTTLMKALALEIDPQERLITIEDTPELSLPDHPNRVHLFYSSEDRDSADAIVTPTTLLRSCYRMRPDRILVAELRGSEAREWVAAASSGHSGSITSVHAGSCDLAFERIAQMIAPTDPGGRASLVAELRGVIDVVVHMDNDTVSGRGRHVTAIHYDPQAQLDALAKPGA